MKKNFEYQKDKDISTNHLIFSEQQTLYFGKTLSMIVDLVNLVTLKQKLGF